MAQQQQFSALLDRLETIISISSAALESETYEPGRRDLEFIVDSVLDVVDGMKEEGINEKM
ncbi:MAG: hypothetical protein A4E65_02447 [Syntrophorhabdus sp. PtaU1.Bin153]|nr:MAG: hypothetical protein A4E65_02447 [Syntrophorhabdus sp. PtaU1.Bin153]